MDIQTYMHGVGRQARAASRALAQADTRTKNHALEVIADALVRNSRTLLGANAKDLADARHRKLEDALVDRLTLTQKTIEAMADGLRQIAKLPDPVGEITGLKYRPTGIQVG
ncbi:MAG TPA: gamma-glutamyl-phosphate reductase, partial [Burkholderiales bacterium]|nr:gamma-glutamyl-phosphate reductase [Burkholderiales bacterium]